MNERLRKALRRQSEIREALNRANGVESGQDGYLAPDKLAALQAELVTIETEIRAALDEADEREGDGRFVELRERVTAGAYIRAALEERAITGAEAELARELSLPERNIMPFAALESRAVEERADAATSVPEAAIGQPRQPILNRVFHETAAAYLGAMMPTVPRGLPVYPVMTGGAVGAFKAPGDGQDAERATFTGQNVGPKRATARYLIRVEDAARFEGLEDTLRGDLRMALGVLIDAQAVGGDGQGANLAGWISHASALPAGNGAALEMASLDGYTAGGIDGLYATMPGGVRFFIGTETERKLHETRPFAAAGGTAMNLAQLWRASCGAVRSSYLVSAPSGAQNDAPVYRFVPNGLNFVVPVWDGIELIRDPYTGASKGELALTVIALYGALMVRNNGITGLKLRLGA